MHLLVDVRLLTRLQYILCISMTIQRLLEITLECGHACVPGLVASGLDAEVCCCGPLVISWSSVD